jgi:hypothetical protein
MTAVLAPFVKVQEDKLRLLHVIEMDKIAVQQRHIETILDSQKDLAHSMKEMMEDNNSVIKDWLEGFHRLPTSTPAKAPPVNDDERMWKLEMQALAKEFGRDLTANMSPYEMEAVIQQGFSGL